MKWYELLASIVSIGFWGLFGLIVFGGAAGLTLVVFPFGLLPFVFIIGWVLFSSAEESFQFAIGSRIRSGITEYPLEVSMCLYGENENKIAFSDDGRSVILTVEKPNFMDIENLAGFQEYLKEHLRDNHSVNLDWVDHFTCTSISEDKDAGVYQLVISIPDEVVLTDQYIDHEIQNIGRVFKRNNAGNSQRWLLYRQGDRRIMRKGGKLFVYIDRLQLVPGIFDEKQKIMSERQITRNIKNRLWNRVDVKCISIDQKTYCGEISLSSTDEDW